MKILTFSAYYTPEIAASMYLTEDIMAAMAENGDYVNLYVPTPTRGISEQVRTKYQLKKYEELYNGHLIIHRISLFRESSNPLLRALRYALMNIIFIWKGLFAEADAIFVQSTPPTQGLMAGLLKALKHIPFIYNLQDIFPDSLVNTGLSKENSFIWKIGRIIENYTYKKADKIIVISEDFKENILVKGVAEEKIRVVPNWADTKGVYQVDRKDNLLIKRYHLDPEKFYITYSGNIGYTQNMNMLLDAAKELMSELTDLRFILIGDGAAKHDVERRMKEEHIENVILLPFQPYEDIAHVFSLGDVGLIISKQGVGNNSVPSKTWNIMAAKRPVLASFDEKSALCELIQLADCGLIAKSGDKEELKKAIKSLYVNSNIRHSQGKAGEAYVHENLNKERCVQKYIDVMNEVGNRNE